MIVIRKSHISWNDEYCLSRCTLSLIEQHLDNVGRNCNRAASCVLIKWLALLWCGREFLEIISSFFFSPLEIWVLFLQSLIAQTALCVSNKEMKLETNVIAILT